MAAYSVKLLWLLSLVAVFSFNAASTAVSSSYEPPDTQGGLSLAPKPEPFNESIQNPESEQLPLFAIQPERSARAIGSNTNPLALAHLFRRQGCSFYRSGSPRTCVDSSNKCCIDPNDSDEGWCCDITDFCGPNSGTGGKCTYRITYTTSTYWVTDYTTIYSTFTSSIAGTTEWTTVDTTYYVTVSTDADTATVWDILTISAPRAGRKAREVEMTKTPKPYPSATSSIPSITSEVELKHKPQEVLQPEVTEAPQFIKIRGLLYPRQSMRTDTSEYTVTRTSWVTRISETTFRITYHKTSTRYDTTTSTYTVAVNADTTVTRSKTVTLRPGETAPSAFDDDEFSGGGGGGGSGRRSRGLSIGTRAGIGVGVSLGIVIVAAVIGVFIKKKKAQELGAATSGTTGVSLVAGVPPGQDGKQPSVFIQGPPPAAGLYPPTSPPPPSDPRYSQMSQSPQYGTPSPGPQYGYPPNQAPVPMGSSPLGPSQQSIMGQPLMQQQYQAYPYPQPPSPVVGGQVPASVPTRTSPAYLQQTYQPQGANEMPTVYSPQPLR